MYSKAFKTMMIQKMMDPERPSVETLVGEIGVSRSSLYRWLSEAGTLELIDNPEPPSFAESMQRLANMKRPQDWSAEEKLAAVLEAASLSEEELGAFLRRRGLHEAQIQQWRDQMLVGLEQKPAKRAETKRIRELEKELKRKDKALAETAALLVLKKKSPGHLGGRGRRHGQRVRQQALDLIEEAVSLGARLKPAADTLGLAVRTIQRWRHQDGGDDGRHGPLVPPANKLTPAERQEVLSVANSPKYRELSPQQIVPRLADEGRYIASESTFYRILREENQLAHRERCRPATHRRPREKVATGPCQVWSWDITYLRSTITGKFFYLYMILDVWSRKIMAATVFSKECGQNSVLLFVEAFHRHRVDPKGLVLHADNGGPMKGSTMLATLQRLGVVPSFSRPGVSNDNPFSESLFRTMKYRPEYPARSFVSDQAAQKWVNAFVHWYNTKHLHSEIRFVTPDDRHYGREAAKLSQRKGVYEEARQKNPCRWTRQTRNWNPVEIVRLNPERKRSPEEDLCSEAA